MTRHSLTRNALLGAIVVTATLAGPQFLVGQDSAELDSPAVAAAPPPAMPVSVAVVAARPVTEWQSFSGRLEAVGRVELRSRVAGAVDAIHFQEGSLVAVGDLLVTIDPRPYQAEVARAEATVAAAESRLALARNELDRGKRLVQSRTMSQSDYDQRINGESGAIAELEAAKAVLRTATLNLGYTEIRAPIAGRVGRIEVTVGNLIEAGAASPVLTTLVSVSPIYASFEAGEDVVAEALGSLPQGADPRKAIDSIPVRMDAGGRAGIDGELQLIDNTVDPVSGTVRIRASFANTDGSLMPGQFARLSLGGAKQENALLVSERAVGTDQDKKYVFVVGADNKAEYREIALGGRADGLRIVTEGLKPDERIVINGLQRVRPGATVAPEVVAMDSLTGSGLQAAAAEPPK
ncbi:MexE family multidrug efflux RND transporter periplasmic adaptor subunit [Aureimonas sp. SA4125]|uniref:efflux RND transporter periplasmic adaptor subunit n=1 Tax=Aureimonas sp. SA4125 TaxID=2826993 RepID=UPI001CC4B355|nr:efflux RND transporter periplasmic adaptor subunit [Aureimonas sp. SA4125]BDA83657.1 MexE family multidrug efflux RND transporter periplasmic adaptor subunit [Aureimonas sp. SA4125]